MKAQKCIAFVMVVFCIGQLSAQNLNIIPEPYQIEKGNGIYILPKFISINAPSSANEVVTQIVAQLELVTGEKIKSNQQNATIQLSIVKDENLATEGYTLIVNKNGIQIKANTNRLCK
jgi:N-acetyl-beta-hexosaminidase